MLKETPEIRASKALKVTQEQQVLRVTLVLTERIVSLLGHKVDRVLKVTKASKEQLELRVTKETQVTQERLALTVS